MSRKKYTIKILKKESRKFCECKTLEDISQLLLQPKKTLVLMAFQPMYYHFSIPKKNGGHRHIEAPEASLKKVQRQLNQYLQAVYYGLQSEAAYGYIPKAWGAATIKNIRTHAERHLGCNYLLNTDFSNFFHQISIADVTKILGQYPFRFDKYTAHTLAKICCYKERLPMGAPTSPVLSNFYCLPLDEELSLWAKNGQITYTRFVDDLSFSTQHIPLQEEHLRIIRRKAKHYHLTCNSHKTIFYNKNDTKIVTGLALNETVDIPKAYYEELDRDIKRLRAVIEVQFITGVMERSSMLQQFKQEIMGKINFIAQIEGANSSEYQHYVTDFYNAKEPPEDFSVNWLSINNYH